MSMATMWVNPKIGRWREEICSVSFWFSIWMQDQVIWNCNVCLFSSLSPFCQFAKMTKWYVPEPKKSSTSLKQRRSTSCDHTWRSLVLTRSNMARCPSPETRPTQSHQWRCDPVPFLHLKDPRSTSVNDTPPPPIPIDDQVYPPPSHFYHTETGLFIFQTLF